MESQAPPNGEWRLLRMDGMDGQDMLRTSGPSLTGDILRWHFVPFHRGRLRDMNIMILRDALFVEFQRNDLLDLSLNTRLALGITEMETHPGWTVGEYARRLDWDNQSAHPGYPVGRLGAGTLSCWPARVELELADGWSITMCSDFQGLGCGPELIGLFWGCRVILRIGSCAQGEPLRMMDSRVLKEGRVTELEGRDPKGGSCPGDKCVAWRGVGVFATASNEYRGGACLGDGRPGR